MSDVTTTEPTVESALKELREMFPANECEIVFSTHDPIMVYVWGVDANSHIKRKGKTLAKAMAQVRAWREQQESKE